MNISLFSQSSFGCKLCSQDVHGWSWLRYSSLFYKHNPLKFHAYGERIILEWRSALQIWEENFNLLIRIILFEYDISNSVAYIVSSTIRGKFCRHFFGNDQILSCIDCPNPTYLIQNTVYKVNYFIKLKITWTDSVYAVINTKDNLICFRVDFSVCIYV